MRWSVKDKLYPKIDLVFSDLDPYREDIPFLYDLPEAVRWDFEKEVLGLGVGQTLSTPRYKYTRID